MWKFNLVSSYLKITNVKNILVGCICLALLAGCVSSRLEKRSSPQKQAPLVQVIELDSGNNLEVRLTSAQMKTIGHQIYLNETGGKPDKLVFWNPGEDFPSMGIGHFIWVREDSASGFGDSFKGLLKYMQSRGAKFPPFLNNLAPYFECPWQTYADYKREEFSNEVEELRVFLADTFDIQVQYFFERLSRSLPQIFASLQPSEKTRIRNYIVSLSKTNASWYPIVDYVNFKGSGHTHTTVNAQGGWGLKQVLLSVDTGSSDFARAFYNASKEVLTERTSLRPYDLRWLEGWDARMKTYYLFDVGL